MLKIFRRTHIYTINWLKTRFLAGRFAIFVTSIPKILFILLVAKDSVTLQKWSGYLYITMDPIYQPLASVDLSDFGHKWHATNKDAFITASNNGEKGSSICKTNTGLAKPDIIDTATLEAFWKESFNIFVFGEVGLLILVIISFPFLIGLATLFIFCLGVAPFLNNVFDVVGVFKPVVGVASFRFVLFYAYYAVLVRIYLGIHSLVYLDSNDICAAVQVINKYVGVSSATWGRTKDKIDAANYSGCSDHLEIMPLPESLVPGIPFVVLVISLAILGILVRVYRELSRPLVFEKDLRSRRVGIGKKRRYLRRI